MTRELCEGHPRGHGAGGGLADGSWMVLKHMLLPLSCQGGWKALGPVGWGEEATTVTRRAVQSEQLPSTALWPHFRSIELW